MAAAGPTAETELGADVGIGPGAATPPGGQDPAVDRFAAVAPRLDIGDGGGDLLVEGTAATKEVRSESEVRSSAQLRWVLLAVGGVLVLIFGLSQWPGGDATNPDAETAAAEDDREAAETGEGDSADSDRDNADSDDEARPDPDRNDEDGTVDDDGAVEEDATTTTIDSPTDDPSAVEDEQQVEALGPVAGEELGLGLIVANPMTERLSFLNLDTGRIHEMSASGVPLGLIGGTLFAQHRDDVKLIPLDSLEAEGEILVTAPSDWSQVISITDDRAWVIEGSPSLDSNGWVVGGYDASGQRVEESVYNPVSSLLSWDPRGEFRQGAGGGVYRRTGSRFERVSTGVLIAAGENLALVRECDDRMACSDNWYQRDDWEPVDLPAPSIPGQGRVVLQGGDRWLYVTNWVDGSATLYEVASGAAVREVEPFDMVNRGETNQASISSDGRWWFEMSGPTATLVDLDSGTEWSVDNDELPAGASGVFVDLADIGFLP